MTVLNTETRRALRLAINQRRRELVADDGPVPDPYHGTHASYRNGCRCDQCRDFMSTYTRTRRRRDMEHQRAVWRAAHERRRARKASAAFANACSETPANHARTSPDSGVARRLRASTTGGSLDA